MTQNVVHDAGNIETLQNCSHEVVEVTRGVKWPMPHVGQIAGSGEGREDVFGVSYGFVVNEGTGTMFTAV